MLIGYAWVSAAAEGLDLQKDALDRGGVDRLFVDVASGAKARRPQLEQALSQLRAGDTLVVWKLDRLDRSLGHLVETAEDLTRRGIGFRSLEEHIDTTTATGKLMFHAFVDGAKFSCDLIREQAGAGRTKARPRGRRGGRKPKLDEKGRLRAVTLYKDPSNSVEDICQMFQIGPRTLYRYVGNQSARQAGRRPEAKTGHGRRAREKSRSPAGVE